MTTTVKRNDTRDLSITCTDAAGPVDLTAASEVLVIARLNGAPLFSRAVTGSNVGVVAIALTATDTETAGTIQLEVQATWTGGKVTTFPEDGYLTVYVVPDLG